MNSLNKVDRKRLKELDTDISNSITNITRLMQKYDKNPKHYSVYKLMNSMDNKLRKALYLFDEIIEEINVIEN